MEEKKYQLYPANVLCQGHSGHVRSLKELESEKREHVERDQLSNTSLCAPCPILSRTEVRCRVGLHFLNLSPSTDHLETLPPGRNPKLLYLGLGSHKAPYCVVSPLGSEMPRKAHFLQNSSLSHWHVVLVGGDQTRSVGKQRESPEQALHPITGHLTQVWVSLDANHAEGGAVLFLPWWSLGSPKQGSASGV